MRHGSWTNAAGLAAAAGLLLAPAALGGEPINDWFPGEEVTGVPSGLLISAQLEDRGCGSGGPNTCNEPDTTLGIFDEDGILIEADDNDSFTGNGAASAVYLRPVEPSRLINWRVSGGDDLDFDGFSDADPSSPHAQFGLWTGFAIYYDDAGEFVDTGELGELRFVQPDQVFSGQLEVPAGVANYDLFIDNVVPCECYMDVDFYQVSGLTPNADYEIRVTDASFDVILGLLDANGALIDYNDDDPVAGCCLSVLTATADADGNLWFVISGYEDLDFGGSHDLSGSYQFVVEPFVERCNEADLALPYGQLNPDDVTAFVGAFLLNNPVVDSDQNEIFDLADIIAFINAFAAGCP